MTRINTNVGSLIATRIMGQNDRNLSKTLERLSTGYQINRGADNPAGLIASESLRSDKAAIQSAISNAERAHGLVSTAEGALSEVSDLLIRMQALVSESASSGGLTSEEIDANQTQVDGIIDSINRIASQTSFQGIKLLDGSLDFVFTNDVTDTTDISVNAAKIGSTAEALVVTVGTAATRGSAGAIAAVAGAGSVTYEITGAKGVETFTFGTGATQAQVSAAVNAASSITGVKASGNALVSTEYGSDQFVRVRNITGTATGGMTASNGTAGVDAVVTIDGNLASVDNYKASLKTGTLDIDFTMTSTFVATAANTDTITIQPSGGARFQISPNIGTAGQETLGIPSVASHRLGAQVYGHISDIATGKSDDLATDAEGAQNIVDTAIKQVATLRGRVGSFLSDTLGSTVNSLQIAFENISAAESAIRDTDFASETAALTRNQILVSASTSVLALANAAPQAVLSLLR